MYPTLITTQNTPAEPSIPAFSNTIEEDNELESSPHRLHIPRISYLGKDYYNPPLNFLKETDTSLIRRENNVKSEATWSWRSFEIIKVNIEEEMLLCLLNNDLDFDIPPIKEVSFNAKITELITNTKDFNSESE